MKELIDIVNLLEEDKTLQIFPQGYSMYPMLIPHRDSVILVKADWESLKRGDVVLYRRKNGMLVLHRIWKLTGDKVYMIGDNQDVIEGPLEKEQIKGLMVAFVRKGRTIAKENIIYLILSRVWLRLRPFRRIMKTVAARIRKIVKHHI